MLLQHCARFGITIANTLFQNPDIHQGTWQHWHMIDHIIVSQHYKSDVIDCRVKRSADCWKDHKMMCARLNLRFHSSKQKCVKKKAKRLNTASLCVDDIQKQLAERFSQTRQPHEGTVEENWQASSRKCTGLDPINSVHGLRLTKKEENFAQKQHLSSLLNQYSNADPTVLDGIPQEEIHSLEATQSRDELLKALSQQSLSVTC